MVSRLLTLTAYSAVALCSVLTATQARGDLRLTPTESVREQDGIKFKQLEFTDGKQHVTYEAPSGWTYVPQGASRLNLYPRDKVQADASIQVLPLRAPLTFDADCQKALLQQILAMIPKSAERLKVLEEEPCPLRINGQPTYGATLSYSLFGQKFQTNVLITATKDCEIIFTLTSHEADFAELQKAFRGSLFGLQWL